MSDFTRKHNVEVIDNKKYEFGVDGDTYYDEQEYGVKLKGSKDDITVLARKKYVDGEIATLKKYVDDENQKQDVKIDKNTADIVDLSNRVTSNESDIINIIDNMLETSIIITDIMLTPISEVTFDPSSLKAILTVIANKIISVDIYIHDLNTNIGDITTGNDLKFNVSLNLPEGFIMSPDRGDYIAVCDTGGNSYLTSTTKMGDFMNYKAYSRNLKIDEKISFDLTLYSNVNYTKGSVNLYDLVINII